jgi:hypothetical protein
MYEIAVMNPRSSRKKRKGASAVKHRKRSAKGRFVKRHSNPRTKKRKRARVKHRRLKVRKSAHRVIVSNPRRRKRRHNPRRVHRAKRRSNPRFSLSGITSQLKPALIGGAGAVVNGMIVAQATKLSFVPTLLKTGYGLHATRIASALALGMLGKKFGGRLGEQAGTGALTVSMYMLVRDLVVSFAPSVPLGDYEEISITANDQQVSSIGYLPDGSRSFATDPSLGAYFSTDPGLGAYMDPASRLGAYMSGTEESPANDLMGMDY